MKYKVGYKLRLREDRLPSDFLDVSPQITRMTYVKLVKQLLDDDRPTGGWRVEAKRKEEDGFHKVKTTVTEEYLDEFYESYEQHPGLITLEDSQSSRLSSVIGD